MSTFLVLTVIADDKPGIVEQLSSTISEHGGNWLESRMAQMAGKFAGILRVGIEESQCNSLIGALSALGGNGISVYAEQTQVKSETVNSSSQVINVVANDRPGIVREVSQTLSQLSLNVLDLTTYCESAEMSAVQVFRAQAIVEVTGSFDRDALVDALEALSDDLMVEIDDGTVVE